MRITISCKCGARLELTDSILENQRQDLICPNCGVILGSGSEMLSKFVFSYTNLNKYFSDPNNYGNHNKCFAIEKIEIESSEKQNN